MKKVTNLFIRAGKISFNQKGQIRFSKEIVLAKVSKYYNFVLLKKGS